MRKGSIASIALTLSTLLASGNASAAGLYFSDRGVRPLGRGGAFVAGADDLGAIWYNPAGIIDAGTSILFDASWLNYTSEYTRSAMTTSATGTTYIQKFPMVNGSTSPLPIPTIVGSYAFGNHHQYAIAAGMYAPMVPVTSYPQTVTAADGTQQPSPQRYSLVSLDGSLLVVTGLWFAYKPIEQLRIGVGVQALVGTFKATVDFSACPPDNLLCAAEEPSYDAFSQLNVGPIFAPSGNAGVTYVPEKFIRFGLSGQAPFYVSAPATVNVRLPNAPEFDNAVQQGNNAHVTFFLPPVLRFGVEVRPLDESHDLRIEVAYVREFWSLHKSIDITPTNIELLNVTGFPSPYSVSPISIPRGGQDSNSIRAGAEYKFAFGRDYALQLRGGVAYETSGIQQNYVSAMTIDSNKVELSGGGGLYIGRHLRLDAVVGHVFASDVTVDPRTAAVPRVNPVQGNPTQTTAVNGGTYSAAANVLGVGLEYRF